MNGLDFLRVYRKEVIGFVIGLFLLFMIIIFIIVSRHQANNGDIILSRNDKIALDKVRRKVGRFDYDFRKLLVEADGWKVFAGKDRDDKYDTTIIITHNDELVLGPQTSVTLIALINNKVSDKIIQYLYPDKPQYVRFDNTFYNNFQYQAGKIKIAMTSFAVSRGIDLNRVTIVSDNYKKDGNDPRSDDHYETTTFQFRINKDPEIYNFEVKYIANDLNYIYTIFDHKWQQLYQSQDHSD